MYKPKFETVQGYSSVDHFGPEIEFLCEKEAKPCKTKAGAIKHGMAILRRVKRQYNANRKANGSPLFSLPAIRVIA